MIMNKEYKIKEYNSIKFNDLKVNLALKEYLIRSCLNVANKANFATDYDDVKNHIFENENYLKLFIVEDNNDVIPDIKGFAICDSFNGYNNMKFLHCHGIILSPEIQGLGLSKKIINYAINIAEPEVITVKTHNPRCFNTFIDLDNVKSYYPNGIYPIPREIIELSKTDPFISKSDENLVYRNAYPDEKIQQTKRNTNIDNIFNKVLPNDAQSIVIILNDEKLNTKKKVYKNEYK